MFLFIFYFQLIFISILTVCITTFAENLALFSSFKFFKFFFLQSCFHVSIQYHWLRNIYKLVSYKNWFWPYSLFVEFYVECYKLQAFCDVEVSISDCRKITLLKFPEMHVHSCVNKFYKFYNSYTLCTK